MAGISNTWGIKRADRGYLGVGPLVIPVQNGSRMIYPPRYHNAEGTSNNVFDVSYYRGLAYPTFNGPVDATRDWFTAANLNAWIVARGQAIGVGYDDVAPIQQAVAYSDGNIVQSMLGAKGNMLTFGCRQNEQLRCSLGLMGTDKATAPFSPAGIAPNILQRASFADVVFVSGVHGVKDFTFSHMNNLRPNPIFGEGTGSALVEVNAGKPTVTLDVTVDATGTYPVNESSIVFTVTPPGGTPIPFTIPRIRIDNPDDIGKSDERAEQSFRCLAESVDGVAFPYTVG